MARINLSPAQKEANKQARKEAKQQAATAARIAAEKGQKEVAYIDISIEWKKSRTWGSIPNCSAYVRFKDGTGETSPIYKAGGCGYDKESTVIADVFNDYLKYKLWNKTPEQLQRKDYRWKEENGAPYGVRGSDEYRTYEGGIGANCYNAIAEYIGGKFERIASGKTYDAYKYTDL